MISKARADTPVQLRARIIVLAEAGGRAGIASRLARIPSTATTKSLVSRQTILLPPLALSTQGGLAYSHDQATEANPDSEGAP
jgi:hypothetical protein